MRIVVAFVVSVVVVAGCSRDVAERPQREPAKLEQLAIPVGEIPRFWMQTDRAGGVLTGEAMRGAGEPVLRWSVSGVPVLDGLVWNRVAGQVSPAAIDSSFILPHRWDAWWSDNSTHSIRTLEAPVSRLHAFVLDIEFPSERPLELAVRPPAGWEPSGLNGRGPVARWKSRAGVLAIYAGPDGVPAADGVRCPPSSRVRVLVLFNEGLVPDEDLVDVLARSDSLLAARERRLTSVLNRAYFNASDPLLTKAVRWFQLSLDGLLITTGDTTAIAGIPWDGAIDGRAIAQSMGGLDFALLDYPMVSSLARGLARWQDTVGHHRTFGRIADRVSGGVATYGGADVAPWFVREAYDHITRSRDTSLLRELYPVIRRSIEGTKRYQTDTYNLVTHGDGETWMNSRSPDGDPLAPRGTRAAEMQLLWYFQQLVGSYAATFLGDGRIAEVWATDADSTGASFNMLFMDTVANRVYDHISGDGKPSDELRPNTMLCLEMIGSELVQQTMLKRLIGRMVYAHGVGSLDPSDPRFSAAVGAVHNGPVWSWLAGPAAYALTRYDRQDVAYTITSSMVRHALDRDLAGTIPEAFEASLVEGNPVVAPGGRRASLHAMSEVLRSLYQDFFGIRIDVPSNVLSVQPRLPRHLTQVDATIQFGTEPVWLLYRMEAETAELFVKREGGEREIVLNVLWTMPDGNAWRGSMRVPPRETTRVTFTSDDMTVRKGSEAADVTGLWNIKDFSRSREFGDVMLAEPPAR
jgi:hypothetical protein